MEGRKHGIRANSISPGLIETDATRVQLEDPEWASYMLGNTLLGRELIHPGIDVVLDGGMKVW